VNKNDCRPWHAAPLWSSLTISREAHDHHLSSTLPQGAASPRILADLRRHAEDFAQRAGFTYTVLASGSDRIIGCVYIYPWRGEEGTADVQSWVRAERAHLDAALHDAVAAWLDNAFPFSVIRYASR
jgi:RimJ/RimL family protein N-acetyltransferase